MNIIVFVPLAIVAIAAVAYAIVMHVKYKKLQGDFAVDFTARLNSAVAAAKQDGEKAAEKRLSKKHRQEHVATARLLADRARKTEKAKEDKRVKDLLVSLEQKTQRHMKAREFEPASVLLEQLIAIARYTGNRKLLTYHLFNQGKCAQNLGDLVRADILIRAAIAEGAEALPSGHTFRKTMQDRLAEVERLSMKERCKELRTRAKANIVRCPGAAIDGYTRAAKLAEEHGDVDEQLYTAYASYGAWLNADKLEEGCAALGAALKLCRETKGEEADMTEALGRRLYKLEIAIKARGYDELIKEALEAVQKKDLALAEEKAREAVAEATRAIGSSDWRVAAGLQVIGWSLMREGHSWEALDTFKRARAIAEEHEGDRPDLLKQVRANIETCEKYM